MQYISLSQLQAKLGNRSRSSIYRDLEAGRLPKPIKLGSRLYWPEAEIEQALSGMLDK
ncbi:MAG: AlpA family phage regulatory protein [Pseudomonadota bacterium]